MKKLFTILFFVVISTSAFSQQLCQASFTYNYNPVGGTLNLTDHSYNYDSTQINVNTWVWTVQYGGATYTFNTQNPTVPINGFSGSVLVCLTIYTSSVIPCQSSICDTINLNTPPPPNTCIAAYTYAYDSLNTSYHFIDQSTTTNGNINSWNWVFTDVNTGVILYTTNNYQNPVVQLPPNGVINVCLTIFTDSGCSATHCGVFYVPDTINTNCLLTVTPIVNQVSVINGNDGSIDLTVTGGTPPYTYSWNTGATTQDINNLTAGVYTVAINSSPACPSYTYTFQILQPFDSGNIIIDTLNSPIIDTCLNFIIDSSYIAGITVSGNTVTAQWVFTGGGAIATLYVTYTFSNFGTQYVILMVNCNGAKVLSTYTSYIYISQILGVTENKESDQINLYPNPATDFVNINMGNLSQNPFTLKIFNSMGQQVYAKSVAAKTSQVGINVNDLSSGVYYVQIDAGNGKPFVKKFVK